MEGHADTGVNSPVVEIIYPIFLIGSVVEGAADADGRLGYPAQRDQYPCVSPGGEIGAVYGIIELSQVLIEADEIYPRAYSHIRVEASFFQECIIYRSEQRGLLDGIAYDCRDIRSGSIGVDLPGVFLVIVVIADAETDPQPADDRISERGGKSFKGRMADQIAERRTGRKIYSIGGIELQLLCPDGRAGDEEENQSDRRLYLTTFHKTIIFSNKEID
jgi:hypothetical protein